MDIVSSAGHASLTLPKLAHSITSSAAGGVTSGIVFGLKVVADIAGETVVQRNTSRHRVRSRAAV